MRTILIIVAAAVALGGAAVWLTRPAAVDMARFDGLTGNADAGERIFYAGGCGSCHATPDSEDLTALAGGYRIATNFGTFVSPNISMSETHGIGAWDLEDFASAMLAGVSPAGEHYFPAFPYTSYVRMTAQDVADLWAYLRTLPAVETPTPDHDLALPIPLRPLLGPWKALYVSEGWRLRDVETEEVARGRYLVEALGHCGACHTPRNILGAPKQSEWLTGAPDPSGKGSVPGIDPGHLDWSAADIAYYLETGFTPDFDSAGGSMTRVIRNLAQLPATDRQAIAAYLKALPG